MLDPINYPETDAIPTIAGMVADWLRGLGCYSVQPIRLTIGRNSWEGAYYNPAHNPGDDRLYLVGELPPSYRRSSRTVYRIAAHLDDWYVMGWVSLEAVQNPEFPTKYHPFGICWQLSRWSVPTGEAIDEWEPTPYRRMQASLETL